MVWIDAAAGPAKARSRLANEMLAESIAPIAKTVICVGLIISLQLAGFDV